MESISPASKIQQGWPYVHTAREHLKVGESFPAGKNGGGLASHEGYFMRIARLPLPPLLPCLSPSREARKHNALFADEAVGHREVTHLIQDYTEFITL